MTLPGNGTRCSAILPGARNTTAGSRYWSVHSGGAVIVVADNHTGFPRRSIRAVNSRAVVIGAPLVRAPMATRPEIEVSGTAARHSRVTSSTTSSTRKRWPLANWSWTKSSDPAARQRFACIPREGACIGLRLDQDRNARSDSFAPGLPLAHRQPFLAVKAIDPVDAGRLSLTPQQNEEPPPLGIMLRMTLPVSGYPNRRRSLARSRNRPRSTVSGAG